MKRNGIYYLLATWCFTGLVWSIYFLAYYPGILSYDFCPQILQYMQGQITTHHPVVHTLLVGSLWKLGFVGLGNANTGIAIYCILQMLVLSLVYLRGAYLLLKNGCGKVRYILYSAFVALFPLNGFMVCTVTKDVLFASFVLLLIITLVDIYFHRIETIPKTSWILLCVSVSGTCIFRNNGKYALLGLFIAFIWLLFKDRPYRNKHMRVLIVSATVFVVTLLGVKGVEVAANAGKGNPREMLSVPMQQMARIAVNNHTSMDAELLAYIEACIGTDYVENYNPVLADPIKDNFDVRAALGEPLAFVKNYFKMFVQYPKDFIGAFADLNAGYLFFWDEICAWINGNYGYIQTYVNEVFLESIGITLRSKLPSLHSYLQTWTTENLYLDNIVWRMLFAPAWYLYLAIGYFVYALFWKHKKHLPIAFFIAAYFVTLLLGPAVQMRYVYPMMISVVFLLLCCCNYGKNTKFLL